MATITARTQLFTYNGSPLPLAGAAFMSGVLRLCRVSANGLGYESVVPASAYPPFTSLLNGGSYLVYSLPSYLPYEIPESAPAPPATQAIFLTTDPALQNEAS